MFTNKVVLTIALLPLATCFCTCERINLIIILFNLEAVIKDFQVLMVQTRLIGNPCDERTETCLENVPR